MRDDLQHVLTDTYRRGSYRKFRDVRNATENKRVDEDAKGGKVSIHHHRRNTTVRRKNFGENWAALVGLVEKSVGRRWDTFYGELCKAYDPAKQVNYHIFQHLFGGPVNLELNCKVKRIGKKDVVCALNNYDKRDYVFNPKTGKHEYTVAGSYEDRWVPLWERTRVVFYVDPRDGLIKRNKWHDRAKQRANIEASRKKVNHSRKILSATEELHLEEGIWWLYTKKHRPAPERVWGVPGYSDDAFSMANAVTKAAARWYNREVVVNEITPAQRDPYSWYRPTRSAMYYASKSQANSKLLRANGLENDAPKEEGDGLSRRELAKYGA